MSIEEKLRLALYFADEKKIHEVFNEIYTTYGKLIYFTISKYLNNHEDIEDLTQEVFLKFFNNLNKNDIRNIKYYLVTAAKNTALNFLRNQKLEIELDEKDMIEELCDNKESDSYEDIINDVKEILNDEESYIVLQHVVSDRSFKDIADEYGKNINTIMAKYYRAIKKIQKRRRRK